jgi:ABC-type amino acid transport system permease subunit
MKMRLTTNGLVILEFALSVFIGIAAAAQTRTDTPALQVGSRVRVSSSTPGLIGWPKAGTVLSQRGDTLSLRPDGTQDSLAVPLGWISRLEVGGGRHSHVGKGMGLGLLTGALVGAAFFAVAYSPSDCAGTTFCYDFGRGPTAELGGAFGGLLGTIIGGAIGAVPTEHWEQVNVAASSVGLRLRPSLNGGLMVSATF